MSETLPVIYLARHGETPWSLTGQHCGLADLPLTERGERNARRLGERLRGLTFAKAFTSPLQRVSRTCELAGFKAAARVDPDLLEWNWGDYEGKTTEQIRQLLEQPDKKNPEVAATKRPGSIVDTPRIPALRRNCPEGSFTPRRNQG
jgi:probable phosphoglycerate mutase